MPGFRARLRATAALAAAPLLVATVPATAHATEADTTFKTASATPLTGTLTSVRTEKADGKVARALAVAARQVGDPYRYGAAGPGAFDCSGLVQFSARAAGFRGVPRTSGAQSGWARRIPRSALKPGDLVFLSNGGRVYHVGFFVGRSAGRPVLLHAPYSGAKVRRERLWTDNWFAGTLRGR